MTYETLLKRLEKTVKELGYKNIEQALEINSSLLNMHKENKIFPFLEANTFLSKNNISHRWFFYGEGEKLIKYKIEEMKSLLNTNAKLMQYYKIDSKNEVISETVESDIMEPTIKKDSVVIIELKDNKIEDGGIYALHLDGNIEIRRISKRLDGMIDIIVDNRKYRNEIVDKKNINIVGKVVSIFSNL